MTVDYFNFQYNQALDALSQLRQYECTNNKWGIRSNSDQFQRSMALFLYIGAISTYDPSAVFNFLSEDQVNFILSQIRTLTATSNNDTIQQKVQQYT